MKASVIKFGKQSESASKTSFEIRHTRIGVEDFLTVEDFARMLGWNMHEVKLAITVFLAPPHHFPVQHVVRIMPEILTGPAHPPKLHGGAGQQNTRGRDRLALDFGDEELQLASGTEFAPHHVVIVALRR